jgi:hypothetical protein
MFRRLPEPSGARPPAVPVAIDGRPFVARTGDSVAAVLLLAGRSEFRVTPVDGAPRGPFCLMGACFDCLVTIDGQPNRQACLVQVTAGMRIDTKRS